MINKRQLEGCLLEQGSGSTVNYTLIVWMGSVALLGVELICLIVMNYVLWTERWEDRRAQKYLLYGGASIGGRRGGTFQTGLEELEVFLCLCTLLLDAEFTTLLSCCL